MAALRRADSSSAAPLITMTPIMMGPRGAFVALGAVGLSLGAAWALRCRAHNKRITCSEPEGGAQALPEQEQPPARSPPKKNRNKRHKSKAPAAAPAACAASVPAAEPPMQLPPSVPEEERRRQQLQQETQPPPKQPSEAPQPLEEEEEEEIMLPAKTLSTASDEPSASSTGETHAHDVEMLDAAAAADATAVSSAGEWIPVERKQRRRRPSPELRDFAEPSPPTVAGGAAAEELPTSAPMAVSPPKSPEVTRPADALSSPAESPQPVGAASPEGGEVVAKKPKKKKKRPAPPPSLYATEDEPVAAPAAAASAAADAPSAASEPSPLEMEPLPPVPAPPPAEVWVEVTSRRGKRAAAHEPRASE